MIKKYIKEAKAARQAGGRAPNITKHYFPRDEVLKVLERSRNYQDACEKMGLSSDSKFNGRAYANLRQIAGWYGIDLEMYLIKGGNRAKIGGHQKMTKEKFIYRVLVVGDKRVNGNQLKGWLFKYKLKERICEECGCDESWYNKPLTLELHHANGNPKDNRISNLQILCPNCHSQTPTHRGRKKRLDFYI